MVKESPSEDTGDIMTSENTITAQIGSNSCFLCFVFISAMLPDIGNMCNGSKISGEDILNMGKRLMNTWLTVWYQRNSRKEKVESGKWKVENGPLDPSAKLRAGRLPASLFELRRTGGAGNGK